MRTAMGIIGIMGSGEDASVKDKQIAFELGSQLARKNFIVLCGGRNSGVMKSVIDGVASEQGISVGILPGSDKSEAAQNITIPIITGMGNARNNINILSSDVIIAIGNTPGTLSEMALTIKNKKPLIALNQSIESIALLKSMNYNKLVIVETLSDVMIQLNEWLQ
ncbi:hypothetical protein ACE01N_06690 [Saccharicrinis sp. FJH2]|uniref:SLOG cluster 4 domain-containing protein n=1 Tax=Saccharicrinis sp. FJH65 TaxID=3344659 RepID=UPI0035F232C7